MLLPRTRDDRYRRFHLSASFCKLAKFQMHYPLLWNTWNDAVSCTRRLESLPQTLWECQVLPDCCTYAHSLLELCINLKIFPCIGVCYLPIVMFHLQFLTLLHCLLTFDLTVPLNCRLSGTTMGRNFLMGIVTEHSMILALWFWIFYIVMRRTLASTSVVLSTKLVRTRLKLPSDVSRKQISSWTLSCQG
jgi:hypothetical protein